MGANGLLKVEDVDGEEGISPDNINPGMKESIELGPVNSWQWEQEKYDVYYEGNL